MLSPTQILKRLTGKHSSPSPRTAMRRPDFLDRLTRAQSCPLVSVVDGRWEFSSSYASRSTSPPSSPLHRVMNILEFDHCFPLVLLTDDHSLTVPLSAKGVPTPNSYCDPSYIINVDGRQIFKGYPETRLVVCPFCEVWLEDQQNNLCRVVVGKLLGRDGEMFVFGCHGCPGYAHHARHHSNCSYGILRVHPEYVHPSLRGRMDGQIDVRRLSRLGVLLCELAYPLGYIDAQNPLLSYEYYFTPTLKLTSTAGSGMGGTDLAHASDSNSDSDSDSEGSDANDDDERTSSPRSSGRCTPHYIPRGNC